MSGFIYTNIKLFNIKAGQIITSVGDFLRDTRSANADNKASITNSNEKREAVLNWTTTVLFIIQWNSLDRFIENYDLWHNLYNSTIIPNTIHVYPAEEELTFDFKSNNSKSLFLPLSRVEKGHFGYASLLHILNSYQIYNLSSFKGIFWTNFG